MRRQFTFLIPTCSQAGQDVPVTQNMFNTLLPSEVDEPESRGEALFTEWNSIPEVM